MRVIVGSEEKLIKRQNINTYFILKIKKLCSYDKSIKFDRWIKTSVPFYIYFSDYWVTILFVFYICLCVFTGHVYLYKWEDMYAPIISIGTCYKLRVSSPYFLHREPLKSSLELVNPITLYNTVIVTVLNVRWAQGHFSGNLKPDISPGKELHAEDMRWEGSAQAFSQQPILSMFALIRA